MASPESVPIFIHLGQSLAVGSPVGADASATPPPVPRKQYFSALKGSSGLRCMSLGAQSAGTFAPMWWFMDHLHQLTGRRSMHLMLAKAGSALLQAANYTQNGFWECDVPGSRYNETIPELQMFLEALRLSPRYQVGDVYPIWSQGQQDADFVNGTTITGALYRPAFQQIHDRLITDIAAVPGFRMKRLLHVELGRRVIPQAGYDQIRAAQNAMIAANPETAMIVFDGAKSPGNLVVDENGYHVSGCGFSDDVHHTGAMNQTSGRTSARNFAIAEGLI